MNDTLSFTHARQRFLLGTCAAFAALLTALAGCGGNVIKDNGVGNNGGGDTGEGGAPATASTSSTTGATTTGQGGSAAGCDGLGHSACLGAYPDCVPVYDDACCPTCDPAGPCADCTDYQYHHCAPVFDACSIEGPPCGMSLLEHCTGQDPPCGIPNGALSPCGNWPGCVLAVCPEDSTCAVKPFCTQVTDGSCIAVCAQVGPDCPGGFVAEVANGCYTGLCIEASACQSP